MAKVLVIDDEKGIRNTLQRLLGKDEHDVSMACDAEDALGQLSSTAFDVVVTDIVMPRITGVDLLRLIKDASPNVQVVMMTGAPNIETAAESLRAGAFDYLPKPISKEMLLKVVNNAARVKHLDDEKLRLEEENRKHQEDLEHLVKERTALLQAERDKLQGVLNGIGQGMYIVAGDYTIEFQNKFFEASFPGATGGICYSKYYGFSQPCKYCLMKKAAKTEKILQVEASIEGGNILELVFSPFADTDEENKTIILMRDITEQKAFQAEAMRAGHLASLGELAAGVAHEINNPINGIISCAEILRDQASNQGDKVNALEENREISKRIIDTGKRVAEIVKNLLKYSRDRKEEYSLANIMDIFSETLALSEKQITKDGIKLTIDAPLDLPKIKARSQELQQVFINMLSNARYAVNARFPGLNPEKFITIIVKPVYLEENSYIRIEFFDNGIGISENIFEKLCNPFFTTKPAGEGTGLGLNISHEIIKNHKGRILFDSIEGEYTKVKIDLPIDNGWV